MKLWAALRSAAIGWMMLLRGEADWRSRFNRTPAGLVTALVIFVFVLFLAVILVAAGTAVPDVLAILAGMFALALPLTAMVVTLLGTRIALKSTEPMQDVLVPGVYALAAFIFVEGLLVTLIGGPVVALSWLVLGYLMFRLARAATSWHTALAVGFAVLTVLLLVAMRQALYMLSSMPVTPT